MMKGDALSPEPQWPLEAGTSPLLTATKETGTPVLQPQGSEMSEEADPPCRASRKKASNSAETLV